MKNKAISPLIATVLLIGFTVALVLVVTTWGTDSLKDILTPNNEPELPKPLERTFTTKYCEMLCPYLTPNEKFVYKTVVDTTINMQELQEFYFPNCYVKLCYVDPIENFSLNHSYFIVNTETYIDLFRRLNTTKDLIQADHYDRLVENGQIQKSL